MQDQKENIPIHGIFDRFWPGQIRRIKMPI